jgi:hypothetical protein
VPPVWTKQPTEFPSDGMTTGGNMAPPFPDATTGGNMAGSPQGASVGFRPRRRGLDVGIGGYGNWGG